MAKEITTRSGLNVVVLEKKHYIQEEMSEQCLDRFFKFFVA